VSLINLIREQWRLITLGLVLNFFSSPGQTYFISVFGGEFRSAFGLTHGSFGLVYSIATLGGALLLMWLGRYIDRADLRWHAGIVCAALALTAMSVSVIGSALALGFSVIALRLTGQGLMTHTAVTSVSRYIVKRRGTAVGFIAAGVTCGVAIFPVIGVALIEKFGWRQSWLVVGIFYLVVVGPLILFLLKGQGKRHAAFLARNDLPEADQDIGNGRQYKLGDVLRDPSFYMILPAFMVPTILFTGFIFHQVHLVETKGWTLTWFTSSFIAYALSSMLASMALGPLIDRFTARRILTLVSHSLFRRHGVDMGF
jgi:MFS family permease